MQSRTIVHGYFRDAIEGIDSVFGNGYAKKNPAVLAAYMQAFATHDMADEIKTLRLSISDNFAGLAVNLEGLR